MFVEREALGRYVTKARELRAAASLRSGTLDEEVLLKAANACEELDLWNQRFTPWELVIRAELQWDWEVNLNRRATPRQTHIS
jgi:hypothetical protein